MRIIDADALTVTHINEVDVLGYKLKYGTGIPVVRLAEVECAPTIEPERKTGKWIKGIDVPGRNPYLHLSDALYCSVCHNEAYWDTDYGQQIFDYCPNCGAKMEGEEDG